MPLFVPLDDMKKAAIKPGAAPMTPEEMLKSILPSKTREKYMGSKI